MSELPDDLAILKTMVQGANASAEKLGAQLDALRTHESALKQQRDQAQALVLKASEEYEKLVARIRGLTKENVRLQAELDTAKDECDRVREQLVKQTVTLPEELPPAREPAAFPEVEPNS